MKKPLLVLLTLGLAACGFHLRGSYDIPPFLQHITVQTTGSDSTLRPELLLALQTVGIDTDGGDYTLQIMHDNLVTQTSALATQTEVSEITLIYDVAFRLRYRDGRPATEPHQLLLRRGYQYDPTSVVSGNTEADMLTRELRTDAVQQIVRQLSALRQDALLPDVDPALLPAHT